MKKNKPFKSAVLFVLFMMIPVGVFSQITVRGTVTDATNETLVGVSIMETGTGNGTVTNVNGNYEIIVANGASLTFSYVGFFSQTIPVRGQQVINVVQIGRAHV